MTKSNGIPRWKRYLSASFLMGKVREKGFISCVKDFLAIMLHLKYFKLKYQKYYNNIENIGLYLPYAVSPSRPYTDSVLAIYDFSVSPFSFAFIEFLANCEVFRVQNSLSNIDMVLVVDKHKKQSNEQPAVTESNYRNWILNLAECTDLLKSISSLSIFDNRSKFLSFYQKVHTMHMVFPDNGSIYTPKRVVHYKGVSDYFHRTGYVPRFESSKVLLDWAEKYFIEKSLPLYPVIVFVRNSKTHTERNTIWQIWLNFFRAVVNKYPVKFFIVNDFWNPIDVPEDLEAKVIISAEATISTKYRCALSQRSILVMGQIVGSSAYVHLTDTPCLMFGMENEYFSGNVNREIHGMTDDLQLPWSTKYQRIFPVHGDVDYIKARFEEMYELLEKDNMLENFKFNQSSRQYNPS